MCSYECCAYTSAICVLYIYLSLSIAIVVANMQICFISRILMEILAKVHLTQCQPHSFFPCFSRRLESSNCYDLLKLLSILCQKNIRSRPKCGEVTGFDESLTSLTVRSIGRPIWLIGELVVIVFPTRSL
jgi:hypothetical protein